MTDTERTKKIKVNISFQAIVAGIILTVTFFLFFLDAQKTYTSSVEILVIPKSPIVSNNEDEVLNNLQQLPKLLSFYQAELKNNPDIIDSTAGESMDQRKAQWDNMVDVERPNPNSSILQLSVTAKQQSDSEILVQKTTRTLLDTASQYYNVKTDVDFRIIDGPITKPNISGLWWILPLSLLLGISIACLIEMVVVSMEKRFKQSRVLKDDRQIPEPEIKAQPAEEKNAEKSYLSELYKTEEYDVPFSFDQYKENEENDSTAPAQELDEINKHLQKSAYPNFPEMPASTNAPTASAPDNLPVADGFDFPNISTPEALQQKPQAKDPHSEPSEEELKKRLNQLLKGEL